MIDQVVDRPWRWVVLAAVPAWALMEVLLPLSRGLDGASSLLRGLPGLLALMTCGRVAWILGWPVPGSAAKPVLHGALGLAFAAHGLLWGGQGPPWALVAERFVEYALALMSLALVRAVGERDAARSRVDTMHRNCIDARRVALADRLSPHFLFNALHSVAGLVAIDARLAGRAISKLGALLRIVIEKQHGQWALAEEIEFVSRYLDLERLRYGGRLQSEIDVAPHLEAVDVPAFVLQPMVENAVKHGVSTSSGTRRIRVAAVAHGSELELAVYNDLDPERSASARSAGFGLVNLERRLEARYGPAARLVAGPDGGCGWSARVVLPLYCPRVGKADEAA